MIMYLINLILYIKERNFMNYIITYKKYNDIRHCVFIDTTVSAVYETAKEKKWQIISAIYFEKEKDLISLLAKKLIESFQKIKIEDSISEKSIGISYDEGESFITPSEYYFINTQNKGRYIVKDILSKNNKVEDILLYDKKSNKLFWAVKANKYLFD